MVTRTYLIWTFLRASCHRGYVLVSGLYFVVVAHLPAGELLLLGTVVAVTMLASDAPAGVWSDAISRRWPLATGHALLAAGMVTTGFVTAFPWIVATQVLWGLGWALMAGADVAWLTDELDDPAGIARALTAAARWELAGGAAGMVAFGVLSLVAGPAAAIAVSGAGMALIGLYVAARFTERHFTPVRHRAAPAILRRGLGLARRDHQILLVLAATTTVNGAGVIGWIFPRRLVELGFPGDPTLWYTALGLLASVAGAVTLRLVEARIDGEGVARRVYALACLAGALGALVLAYAPGALVGGLGVLLVSGVCFTVTRAVGVIWVNGRVTSDVRATVHSFLSQAENTGKIAGGFALTALAQAAGPGATLVTSAALIACAGAMVATRR
ncbi:Major Facilitator Superfamily protein [Nonomuraea solani]|uniref:Major Facilitator Superfamily protein n=1 Tax=Nonomuraea solani TaxID=1144553 RepID=A0A1H6E453_9ACTN|nr:MFS transporter [Nonomuraea solani]SEG91675.1 Major Facilitator Superfamily protein [Nonomuraea solani]